MALTVIQSQNVKTLCDCRFGSCRFTPARVRFYLVAYRQAQILRLTFEEVLRDNCRESRTADPSIRGGRFDPHNALDIVLSLERAKAAGYQLAAWNADKIAAFCCGRSDEACRLE